MKTDLCLKIVIASLGILGIFIILNNKKEGFLNLLPGKYPINNSLLFPAYKMKENPGLSDMNIEEAWNLYPTFAIGDYAQVTNNKRYWSSPCNGTTARADMCGGIYKEQHCDHAPILPPNKHCRRVNYFCS
jgi:hypothetical protein